MKGRSCVEYCEPSQSSIRISPQSFQECLISTSLRAALTFCANTQASRPSSVKPKQHCCMIHFKAARFNSIGARHDSPVVAQAAHWNQVSMLEGMDAYHI